MGWLVLIFLRGRTFLFTVLAQLFCCLSAFGHDCLHYYFMCIGVGKSCSYNCCLYWVPLFYWQKSFCLSHSWNSHPRLTKSICWLVFFVVAVVERINNFDHSAFLFLLHGCYLNKTLTQFFQTTFKNSVSHLTLSKRPKHWDECQWEKWEIEEQSCYIKKVLKQNLKCLYSMQ